MSRILRFFRSIRLRAKGYYTIPKQHYNEDELGI